MFQGHFALVVRECINYFNYCTSLNSGVLAGFERTDVNSEHFP